MLPERSSIRLFQETLAFAIELTAFIRGQTSNARFGDFVENRINRGIDIIWLDGTARVRLLQNADFRLGADSRFHVAPPSEFWPCAPQFNEQERGADARPDHSQISPGVVGEQLEGINAGENQRDPFRHDSEEQLN